jgi:endonuclease/exonuclease/phosphatase family metal-dependent hydrolase
MNLHLPHLNKKAVVKNLEYMITKIDPKLKNHRFVIAGDFNYPMNNADSNKGFLPKLKLFDIEFHINANHIPTCCVPPFRKHTIQFDHVIDSLDTPISITSPKVESPASDHLPIIVILGKNED